MQVRPEKDPLRSTALFKSLDDAALAALVVCLRRRSSEAGKVIYRQGEPGASMLIVVEGTLVAVVRDKDGREQEINRMGPGEMVGEMAFLDPAPRSASVRAATPALYYELDHDGIGALRRHAPAAAAAVIGAVIRDVTLRLRRIDCLIELELARRASARLERAK